MDKNLNKDELLAELAKKWVRDFGGMQNEQEGWDGYTVTGFVSSAILDIERRKEAGNGT